MENVSGFLGEEDPMELPAGFRFHPTDEELISHYLYNKVMIGGNFSCRAIGEVDLNKSEPWELPRLAKMGEREWYFFCMRDRKYPTGLRTNRATEAGYWKATGKDKEIYRGKSLVGMKKTLVFYRGRAPRGEKSHWVMHEYRLDGRFSPSNLPKCAKNEWVISRVFQKNCAGKKIHISDLVRIGPSGQLPLTESSTFNFKPASDPDYVSCFSNSINSERNQSVVFGYQENNPTDIFPRIPLSNPIYSAQASALQLPSSALMEDKSILRQIFKTEREIISVSQETGLTCDMNNEISSVVSNLEMGSIHFDNQEAPTGSAGPAHFDYFWNYSTFRTT